LIIKVLLKKCKNQGGKLVTGW